MAETTWKDLLATQDRLDTLSQVSNRPLLPLIAPYCPLPEPGEGAKDAK